MAVVTYLMRCNQNLFSGVYTDRRRFMKISSAAGLSLFTPINRHAIASEDLAPFDGPYWMTINLAGAWDSTLFCDPKGDVTDETGNGVVNQCYTQEDIVTRVYQGQTVFSSAVYPPKR